MGPFLCILLSTSKTSILFVDDSEDAANLSVCFHSVVYASLLLLRVGVEVPPADPHMRFGSQHQD